MISIYFPLQRTFPICGTLQLSLFIHNNMNYAVESSLDFHYVTFVHMGRFFWFLGFKVSEQFSIQIRQFGG